MFDDATVRDFLIRFPNLTEDDIRRCIAWIAKKDRENPLVSPLGMLESMCRKQSERLPRLRAHEESKAPQKARGSFREDGSWDEILAVASETETALRELAATIIRLRLSPADSVSVADKLPLMRACYRTGTVAVMLRLDAKQIPNTPGHDHDTLSWLDAAWAAVHTSTSAEEFVKREVLFGLHRAKLGSNYAPQEVPWVA